MTEIVVSINPKSADDVRSIQLQALEGADVIEWRADYLSNAAEIFEVAPVVFEKFTGLNLLFTLRTKREGGEMEVSDEEYIDVLKGITVYSPTFLDIEYFSYPHALEALKDFKDKIVLSHHNFSEIPLDLSTKLKEMIEQNVYLVKFSGMPRSERNVLELMYLTNDITDRFPHARIATMAMGSLGKLSRIAGRWTKSAWTFASLGRETAPGQLPLPELRRILEQLDS
ncbi:type I 3-dehydroquinate dehydratase [Floricoccus penangensis]|uniref:type I 3-dehydroquinate dehydratase n=1 Tax=Floricoccus penangensis TaxID=1859475 RepID=UPI00203ED310|nr:type I 3-dehydroquinate dehydratase [Floricoccus penangensis]URZ86906.1 type I 3-dehydroquinate dehydratase [Floricoccus penangensis]